MKSFEEANKIVHPVETQWHHKILAPLGFVPETKEAVGFVRKYTYKHPSGTTVVCTTGMNADYWEDSTSKKFGYWGELEPYIRGKFGP